MNKILETITLQAIETEGGCDGCKFHELPGTECGRAFPCHPFARTDGRYVIWVEKEQRDGN